MAVIDNMSVVVPVCKRPEMLALALQALSGHDVRIDVRIFADTDTNLDEVDYVRDQYYPDAMIFHAAPHIHAPSGMWNILHALRQGYNTGSEFIFIVEEDVVIHPDFFNWHLQAQRSGDFMATCGRRMIHYPNYDMYTNPGSCFHRDKLGLVVKHITNELFNNPKEYQDREFGPMEESSNLDDGLIRRVSRQQHLQVKYPDTSKCSHIGFRAYNQLDIYQNHGDIKTRILNLRNMLPTLSPFGRYSRDFEPIVQ